jgi:hypothetical protein
MYRNASGDILATCEGVELSKFNESDRRDIVAVGDGTDHLPRKTISQDGGREPSQSMAWRRATVFNDRAVRESVHSEMVAPDQCQRDKPSHGIESVFQGFDFLLGQAVLDFS